MASEALVHARESLLKEIIAFDNSFKVQKGSSLRSIIQKIDMNTSLDDNEIKRLFNIWYNLAFLYAKKKSSSLVRYLEDSQYGISELLYTYKRSYSTVFKADSNLLDWYMENRNINIGNPIELYFSFGETYLLEYNSIIYSMTLQNDNNTLIFRSLSDYRATGENVLCYQYTDVLFSDIEDYSGDLTLMCGNKSCSHYQSSMRQAYEDGTKQVFCDWDALRKCKQCEKTGVAHPVDIAWLFEAIAYCMLNRDTPYSDFEKRNDYEHLPKPEQVDDVVIFLVLKRKSQFYLLSR